MGERIWDVRFLLDFNGWEVESVEFLQLTESNPPSSVNGDCVRWILKKNGDFDFCSYYIMLRGSSSIIFSWKGIWELRHLGRFSLFGLQCGERYSRVII